MNAHQQMSGQVPRRVPNQGGQQLRGQPQQKGISLPSQMHAHVVDDSFDEARRQMQRNIIQILQRRSHNPHNTEWLQKLPELARRLEECMFKDAISKDDYVNMTLDAIEQRLQTVLKNSANNNHQQSHNITSSSSISTMIPTPGMTRSGTQNSIVSFSADNSMIATSGAGMVAQTASNAGNMLTTANGSAGILLNPSFHASNGSNRYQQSTANVAFCSGGNSIMSGMSRPLSQMIPTPGLNNPQLLPINSESSNGVGISSMESNMVLQPQQQKQHVGSQNSRMLHALGGQMGIGSRSNFMHKSSPCGFSNGATNGGLGVLGNNMHMVNGPAVSDGYPNTSSYGNSTKSLQQQFDQQHNQPIVQASMSQQILSLPGDGYAVSASDQSVSENLYDSTSLVSSTSSQTVNPMNLHAKAKINETMLVHNASTQPGRQSPHIRSQIYNNPQNMNFQPVQSGREHQPHIQVQSFQQQLSQPCGPVVRRQYQQHQQNQHQQQITQKTDALRQSSISSNFGGQLMSEHAVESHNELLFPQSAEQYHVNELQRQYQQNTSASNRSKGGPLLGHSSQQDFQPVFAQGSRQALHLQRGTESQNEYSSLLNGPQADSLQHGYWQPQSLQKPEVPDKSLFEQHIHEEFQQRLTGKDDAQQPRLEGRVAGPAASTHCISVSQPSSGVRSGSRNSKHEHDYHNQKRWWLFMLHARRCFSPKGRCKEPNCETVQQLWIHMERCSSDQCRYPRCYHSKKLVNHFEKCRAVDCPLCIPVNEFINKNYKARMRPYSEFQSNDSCININMGVTGSMINNTNTSPFETSEDSESCKRMKAHHLSSVVPKMETCTVPTINQPHACLEVNFQLAETTVSSKIEVAEVKIDSCIGSGEENLSISVIKEDVIANFVKPDVEPFISNDIVSNAEEETMLVKEETDKIKIEVKHETHASTTDSANGSKSGKPKIKGVSLTELFTPEQIREHIRSLRQWTGQSKAKAEKNQAMERSMSENSCQLCAVEKLTFEPPPLYCNACGIRIKRNATYYAMGSGDTRHYFCVPCYNVSHGDAINVEGSAYLKAKLEKKKNDEETEEWWVQCDKCEAWQHQICALFNGRRNDGGQAEYTCPNCCIEEIEKGERKPLPQSAVLGAKDLPRTILSDHIEQRLVKRLKQERQERARYFGKSPDEVPGAEALVIRVVSSVDKKLDVKQHFLEIFREENYPTEYPYKSKVILLFQKIEGVEVCLFGMYVQEFGSESQLPNQRRVYLSYLDSVKYFRPEIRTVSGEALRTFVYHEILIGYLEYCKKRGFTSCYIWACPPLKGEDYILYCHPEIQKTPKSDKLREWYLSMLRKASKENIVVELTNLFDHFFASHGKCKAKVTAARLPYFDGDYWPGAAEDMLNQLQQEEDGRKQQKKGKTKKALTKRALKAAGQTDLTGNASKDALLMQKLGETISPMKEDFIMVHLQHSCTCCCLLMASGTRWVCSQCKNFQLCDKCHNAEQRLEERERHPINCREKHVLSPVDINDVPSDTKDKDEILESEFFDTRQAFLSLCQGNHYQYDTLRRAKHSSMMILYHLHNPTAPAFVTSCNVCHHDIETGHGWRCEICPDFDVCNSCYLEGGVDHPHKLTNHPSTAERDAQNQEARQKRVVQLRKMLDLLVHTSQCLSPLCKYPNCRKVKGLFRHGKECKIRASGGCTLCKKMWYLMQLHARACKESDCSVPRCKDLKEHLKRLQQQSDSRRRAAVMEMMRQRAAEVAGSVD